MQSFHALPTHFFKIHFNIISLHLVFQVVSYLQIYPLEPCMHLCSLLYTCTPCPIHHFLLDMIRGNANDFLLYKEDRVLILEAQFILEYYTA